MAYLVLARKWRPQRFEDVVGQEVIIKTLSRALESGRVAHAFLLTGSRGVGKTTIARLFAKALSCEKGISPKPCGTCSHCKEITAGESLDVIEIDGASNTGVDDVRELRENIRYQPSSARFKIFIIDEVHMLSTNAFNALLKTLEEPPPHVKFIFATTESHKIPVTILSRCQRYDFKRISIAAIVERLEFILAKEKIKVNKEALYLIAENSDGGMRDALSLLDQVISFSGEIASAQDVIEILGLVDRQTIQKTSHALLNADISSALEVLDAANESGFDLKQLIDGLAFEFRNLSMASVAGSIKGLADLSEDRIQETDKLAKNFESFDLQRLFSMTLKAADEMAASEHPRMVLELAFIKMANRPTLAQMDEVQAAISRLEDLGNISAPLAAKIPAAAKPAPIKQEIKLPSPVKQTAPKLKTLSAPAVLSAQPSLVTQKLKQEVKGNAKGDSWESFVNLVCEQMPAVGHHLEHARYAGDGQMEFDQKLHFMRVEEACAEEDFRSVFFGHFKHIPKANLSESIHVAKESAAKREQASIEEQARDNPTIKKALEIFGGEIKAVRKKNS